MRTQKSKMHTLIKVTLFFIHTSSFSLLENIFQEFGLALTINFLLIIIKVEKYFVTYFAEKMHECLVVTRDKYAVGIISAFCLYSNLTYLIKV